MEKSKKKPKGYFTTGEFARLCGIKKQTLFHYDHIGLLKPEFTGDNGYRYYSYLQFDTYNTIAMLRGLDIPLATIKGFLDHRNPSSFLKLLRENDKLIDERISELQWLKSFVRRRTDITVEGINARHNEIKLEHRPQEYYMITEYSGDPGDIAEYSAWADHVAYCHRNQIYSPYVTGGMIDITSGVKDDSYSYSHFYTKIDPDDISDMTGITIIPSQTYIVMYSRQGFTPIRHMMDNLLNYASSKGYKTGRYFFEDILLDDLSSTDINEYAVKISIPVSKNN